MPNFGNPFSGLKHDRLLTHEELVRAIRFMVAAEYEATQLYEQFMLANFYACSRNFSPTRKASTSKALWKSKTDS
jgi:hypothetical protein